MHNSRSAGQARHIGVGSHVCGITASIYGQMQRIHLITVVVVEVRIGIDARGGISMPMPDITIACRHRIAGISGIVHRHINRSCGGTTVRIRTCHPVRSTDRNFSYSPVETVTPHIRLGIFRGQSSTSPSTNICFSGDDDGHCITQCGEADFFAVNDPFAGASVCPHVIDGVRVKTCQGCAETTCTTTHGDIIAIKGRGI